MAHALQRAEEAVKTAATLVHNYGESQMESKTRLECGFHDTEAKMPDIQALVASDHRPSIMDRIFSRLGTRNPFARPITATDAVWLLDNTAYRNAKTGKWEAEFVAAVFDQRTGVEMSRVVADIAEKVGIGKGDAAEETIGKRLQSFTQTILPGRVVDVAFGQQTKLRLGPGGGNGISSDLKSLPNRSDGVIVSSSAKVPTGVNGVLAMKTVYAEPEGWGLISDVDDTIKITQTSSPLGILESTFVSRPTPIAGMPELYSYIVQNLITKSAPIFYLSASPYNLYPFLRGFREQFFPTGTLILRDASWMNLSGLLSNLTLGTQQYKVERMTKINSWLPRRKMICIGDSTQSDPEAYGEIYRKHRGWIRLILIRKVTDIGAVGILEKNLPERFEAAFRDVPKNIWHVFEEPKECEEIIADLVGSK